MAEALAGELENARALAKDKQRAGSNGLQAKAADQVKKLVVKNTKRLVFRIIDVAFAATVVGIIVPTITMSFRFIAGNLYGNKAIALEGAEKFVYPFLFLAVLIAIVLLAILLSIKADPVGFIWEQIKNLYTFN